MSVIYRARRERMEKYFNLFKRSEKHNKDKNKNINNKYEAERQHSMILY